MINIRYIYIAIILLIVTSVKAQYCNYKNYNESNGLFTSLIVTCEFDNKGFLWIASYNHGLYKYNGYEFISFTYKDGLLEDDLSALYISEDDTVYIGSFSGITAIKGDKVVKTYNFTENYDCGSIKSIIKDKNNNLWIGTQKGNVFLIENNKIQKLTLPNDIDNSAVLDFSAIDYNGNIWFASPNGALFYYVSSFTRLFMKT